MANLILVCGLPGCGKSTYLSQFKNNPTCKIISRDTIRFSLVKEEEPYFSHEKEVCQNFWSQINEALTNNYNVYVDQTSLNPESRSYLLKHITAHYDDCIVIWFNIPEKICLERNENRKGTRAYVPTMVIRRMTYQFVPPYLEEGFNEIYMYTENNELILEGSTNE